MPLSDSNCLLISNSKLVVCEVTGSLIVQKVPRDLDDAIDFFSIDELMVLIDPNLAIDILRPHIRILLPPKKMNPDFKKSRHPGTATGQLCGAPSPL